VASNVASSLPGPWRPSRTSWSWTSPRRGST